MFTRLMLIFGGLFNATMGMIFFSNRLLDWFFRATVQLENIFFGRPAVLFSPQDPMHLLLIHGFGAGVLILGATLVYSARNPAGYRAFIFIDGIGRLIFGSLMAQYVFLYSLPRTVLLFSAVELTFAVLYLLIAWQLSRESRVESPKSA